MDFPFLFSPYTIGNLTVKNRVVMMPMGTNFALESGGISDRHIRYYEERAKGGVGLIVVENACVDFPLGQNGATQLRIDEDRFIPGMAELCQRVHRHGAKIVLQINHAGGTALPQRIYQQPIAPSARPVNSVAPMPRAITKKEFPRLIDCYAKAALRAKKAGFDGVEVHAGHGYLLSQFLSPLSNHRTDEYGGSLENRARFPRQVMEQVRNLVGAEFPIFVRVSVDEMLPDGNTLEDGIALLQEFAGEADCISASCGLRESIQYQIDTASLPDGWRSYMAKAVKERLQKPVIAMGNIRDPKVAETILSKGEADFIGIGRGLIAEPNWCNKAEQGKLSCLRNCISCNIGCTGNRIAKDLPITCTVNPMVIEGEAYKQRQINRTCNVVVIGGGVAGLEAACTAAEVGCNVFLLEHRARLGGLTASLSRVKHPFRADQFVHYQLERVSALHNLYAFPSTEATVDLCKRFRPDILVHATSGKPQLPAIPGLAEAMAADDPHVFTMANAMETSAVYEDDMEGRQVLILGGGLQGAEAVEFFGSRGATLTLLDTKANPYEGLDPVTCAGLRANLRRYHVRLLLDATLLRMSDNDCRVREQGVVQTIPFDYAYLTMSLPGQATALDPLLSAFRREGVTVVSIGSGRGASQMLEGIANGRNILTTLEEQGYFDCNS